tara:strand:+ start:8966 stop:9289 length:324 start_codon:yes stop_codon:yes gene_type:complete
MPLRDKNRFRKVYPFIRRKPFNVPEGDVIFESKTATVGGASGSDEVTITFTTTFASAPFVTATAYDSAGNNQANVNAYIKSVSTTQVIIGFSAAFIGQVHYQAIQGA